MTGIHNVNIKPRKGQTILIARIEAADIMKNEDLQRTIYEHLCKASHGDKIIIETELSE